MKSVQYLEHYFTRFNCVELNSSFYHLPKETTVEGWVLRTPDTFRFCPKLSRHITHKKRLMETGDSLERFFTLFEAMESRLGPILIQLPPGLLFDRSLTEEFLILLSKYGHDYRFALEARHTSWIRDEVFDLMTQYDVAFVMADSGKRFPNCEVITTDFVYLRFHGPEKLYASGYASDFLQAYAGKIAEWLAQGKTVWAFFNNDFHGFAVKNADQLRTMVFSMYQ
jgi:uncharacterized protein YecE (DUF72 family)